MKGKTLSMPLAPGTPAPDFSLKSAVEGFPVVKLSDNFGHRNTVLLFFPATFSPPCTEELCGLVKNAYPDFGDAAVYAISVDSPFSQKAWREQEGLPFAMLSDMSRKASHAYEVVLTDFLGTGGEASARAVFVVDKGGVIRYSEQTPKPTDMPNLDAVRSALASLG